MPPPEKLKLLTPDSDGDGQTGVTLYALSTILQMAGHKKSFITLGPDLGLYCMHIPFCEKLWCIKF